ncbi:MAG: ADP-ribosylglycohydrolase family protein [Clostridia bacterium]
MFIDPLYNSIKGALFGAAVGDALGSPLKSMTVDKIQANFDYVSEMIGGGTMCTLPGNITDETQLMLMVAESMAQENADPILIFCQKLLIWYSLYPKDISMNTEDTLRRVKHRQEVYNSVGDTYPIGVEQWLLSAMETTQANAFGTEHADVLSRAIFPPLYCADAELAANRVGMFVRLTHNDNTIAQEAIYFSNILHQIVDKQEKGVSLDIVRNTVMCTPFLIDKELKDPKPTIVNVMNNALFALFNTETYEDCVIKVINLGICTNTMGSVAGALAGALYGFTNIKKDFINKLPHMYIKRLENAANVAHKARLTEFCM